MLQNNPQIVEFLSRDTYLTFVFYTFSGIKCGVHLAAIFDPGKWVVKYMCHVTKWSDMVGGLIYGVS